MLKELKVENGRVSARELHEGLEIGTRFNDWIKRMIEYGFEENVDYLLVTQKRVTNNPKNPYVEETDYLITLDMAKEISMLQRSKIGREYRKYFIACEKFITESNLTEEFKHFRETGKVIRKDLTNTIDKELHPSNNFVYSNYTDLIYKKLFGFKAKELKEQMNLAKKDNLRDCLTSNQLNDVLTMEDKVKSFITTFKVLGMDNKEIYQKVKEIINNL